MTLTHCYATMQEFRNQVLPNQNDSRYDTQLTIALNAASRQIDAHTGWVSHGFWQDDTVVARTYEPDENDCLYIPEGISTTTGLVIKVDYDGDGTYESTLSAADYLLEPTNAELDWPVRPYTEIEIRSTSSAYFPTGLENTVQVTAKFGWAAVPDAVKLACIIQATQLFKAPDAAFGVLQLTSFDGAAVRIGGALHPQAEALLVDFSKPRVA